MRLAEQVRLQLEVADRARAFHSAACHSGDDAVTKQRFADLSAAIEAVDDYEHPPALECVQKLVDPLPPEAEWIRIVIENCGYEGADCPSCRGLVARLAELGEPVSK